MFEEIKLVCGSRLDHSGSLSKVEHTGSKMVMSQGILTLCLSTTDMLCQLHLSAYSHQ